jgi:hypothetical protein
MIEFTGTLKEDKVQGLDKDFLEKIKLVFGSSGVKGKVNVSSGKRYMEEHFNNPQLFDRHWSKNNFGKRSVRGRFTPLAQLADEANDPKITKLMKQLVLRTEADVEGTDWGKWNLRSPGGAPGQKIEGFDHPKVKYGSGKWTPGINKINKLIDNNDNLSNEAKTSLKKEIKRSIGIVRKTYGGVQSDHHKGVKADFQYKYLNPETIATMKALGIKMTHETGKKLVDANFKPLQNMTLNQLKEKLASRTFKNKVAAHKSGLNRNAEWYRMLGTGDNRPAPQERQQRNRMVSIAKERIKDLVKPRGHVYTKEEKEEKAKAYQDLLDAGGTSRFASYWTKFLPKDVPGPEEVGIRETESIMKEPLPPSVEEVGIRETESIMAKPDEQALRHFDREESGDQKIQPPRGYPDEEGVKLALEGSAIPLKNEDIELKEQLKLEEQVPEKEPTQPIMDIDVVDDYKMRQAKGFQEGGSVLKEPELSEDEEIAARQTGDTDIISEAVEDKVEGTQPPKDSWLIEKERGVVQEEPGDTTKMSIPEVQEKLKETLEVSSEPGSDTVKLTTRPDQVKKRKVLKEALTEKKALVEAGPPDEVGIREAQKLGITDPSQQVIAKQVKDEQITEKAAQPPVDAEPKALDLQSFIRQSMQRDEDARKIMNEQLAAAADVENRIQKVEPFRFWNNMSTPAKIVAGIGMLVGTYAAKDSPAGLQAVMNVIDGAVNADIQAQKLTQQQQLVVAKEATRRAKAAVDRYKATATSPQTKAKLLELAQALEVKRAGIAKKQQLQHLRGYVMNQARDGKLHLVPPSLMRMVYPKEDMKRIDTMRTDYEKERKERKIQPVLSAYRRMHNLISRDEEISGMDDIAIVFSFMKLLDPGSVVRESEFETAANAGPRAKYFARQWNRFITGGRFTQADRRGFLKSALTLVKPALDEEKQLQKKYISMSRRYGYPAAFIIPPSTRYFDLPGTMDEAAIRKIMKERGKTYEEAYDIHNQVAKRQAAKPRVSRATKHRQKMGF